MRNWFAELEFHSFSDLTRCTFMELDSYADYTFKNGIWIRVLNGVYADTVPPYRPYEMIVRKPHCGPYSIPKLSRTNVILKMEELHLLKTIE